MGDVIFTCDRCKKEQSGIEFDGGTGGFYRRDEWWGNFMDDEEDIVCDSCIHSDKRYIGLYGQQLNPSP